MKNHILIQQRPILQRLAKDKYGWVRQKVSANHNTPISLLKKLARDENLEVRLTIACNSNTPASILQLIADDDGVCYSVTTNLELLSLILERWYQSDKSQYVNSLVVQIPNIPELIWQGLNSNLRESMLPMFVEDEDDVMRQVIAKCPDTPIPLLEKLVRDRIYKVAYQAKVNLNLRSLASEFCSK